MGNKPSVAIALGEARYEIVRQAKIDGCSDSAALSRAGYGSERCRHVTRARKKNEKLRQALDEGASEFQRRFQKKLDELLPPEQSAEILASIAKKGRDFDRVQAIKTAGVIVMKRVPQDTPVTQVQTQNNLGVFVIPKRMTRAEWDDMLERSKLPDLAKSRNAQGFSRDVGEAPSGL